MKMNLKRLETSSRFSSRLAGVMTVAVFISMADPVASQSINSTLMASLCSFYHGMNSKYFLTNLNTTLSSLRQQLLVNGVHYAVTRTLLNGESVWGLASCRSYVSTTDCVACFDNAVDQLKVCGLGNGAKAFYTDCDLRYENYNFYTEANNRAGLVKCGNSTSPQPVFRKTVEGLISDLRTAAPRMPNYYAVSTRRVAVGNVMVYAIAQCNLNLSKTVCQDCLDYRFTSLDGCLPATDARAIENGCFMRYSSTPFFGVNQTTNITPFLGNGDSSKKRSIIGGVIGGACFLLLLLAFFLCKRQHKTTTTRKQDKSTGSTDMLQGPIEYSYDDIKMATNNFSSENKLGGGLIGEVYKGNLKDGVTVAIRKIVRTSTRGKMHIFDELKIICNVHHRHLIRLLGYCKKGPILFLVHEYMDNGSLDQFLYGGKAINLNWRQRFDIIYGTARGLAYLHEQYHVTIIHRDIKTNNILLDNEFQPKIADFGLIRLLPEDKTHLTTKFAGSMDSDHVAPEYAIHGQLSEKVDIYSFGIMVLEIVSGKRSQILKVDDSVGKSLLDHAWNLYDSGAHLNLIDERLDVGEYAIADVKKIIELGLMCTQSQASTRPAMSEVVTRLSDKSVDEMTTKRPTVHGDDVKIHVDSLASVSSGATTSTVHLSGR